MKLYSIKTAAALALLRANKFAFAGFLKGTVEVKSDTDESEGCRFIKDPCIGNNGKSICNSKAPFCVIDSSCNVSCQQSTTTAATEPAMPKCDICDGVNCRDPDVCHASATCDSYKCGPADVISNGNLKVQSDTDESEGCFSDPCPNVRCNGNKICKAAADCTTKCVRPQEDDEEEEEGEDVKVQSDTYESEGCFSDPCPNVRCNGNKICKAAADCTTKCVCPQEDDEEEEEQGEDVKVQSDTYESEGCRFIKDPCIGNNGKSICNAKAPFCVIDSSCNVSCQQSTTTTAATEPAMPICDICDGVNCRDPDVCHASATCDSYKCGPADVMSNGDLKTEPLLMQE